MKITKRQLRNLIRESIIKEMKPFRMPDSYYDPPDGEEIPEAVEAALEDIYDKAADSPNKEHTFSGPDGIFLSCDLGTRRHTMAMALATEVPCQSSSQGGRWNGVSSKRHART